MKKTITLVLIFAFFFYFSSSVAVAKLIACVGDSDTYGQGLPNREQDCYPAQLERILQQFDPSWETRNFGVNGAGVLRKGWRPYIEQSAFNNALTCEPDVVVINLGWNDSVPDNWMYKDDFITDFLILIDAFTQLPSQPRIYVCYPITESFSPFHSRMVIRDEVIPLISQLPTLRDVQVIDLYEPLNSLHLFQSDRIHLNVEGTRLIAEIVASAILGFWFLPDFNGNGKVEIEDLIILIEHWRQSEPALDIAPPPYGDGIIDVQDLEIIMQFWGQDVNDPTLVAHWALDETEGIFAADSARDNDAFVVGGATWQLSGGQVDGALQLDGVDGCAIAGFALNPADGPFSIIAWVKGGAPRQVVVSQQATANWLTTDTEGNLMTELKGIGRSVGPLLSETVITDGKWHRIGLVWDGSKRKLFVDGVAVAEDTQPSLEGSQMGLYLGTGKAMEPGTYFSGLIDDVRIYNRVVSP